MKIKLLLYLSSPFFVHCIPHGDSPNSRRHFYDIFHHNDETKPKSSPFADQHHHHHHHHHLSLPSFDQRNHSTSSQSRFQSNPTTKETETENEAEMATTTTSTTTDMTLPESMIVNKMLFTIPRGGASEPSIFNGIPKETFANALSILASLDGITGSFFPITTWYLLGMEIGKGTFAEFITQAAVGAGGSTIAIASFLSVSKITSPEHAIAYGWLMQQYFCIKSLLVREYVDYDISTWKILLLMAIFGWVQHALFTDLGEPLRLATGVSLIMGMLSMSLAIAPEIVSKRFIGLDLSTQSKSFTF